MVALIKTYEMNEKIVVLGCTNMDKSFLLNNQKLGEKTWFELRNRSGPP